MSYLSNLCTQSLVFGFVFQVLTQDLVSLFVSHSHPLSSPLFPSVGDDDSFSVVALERDTEGSEEKAVLSKGLAMDISHPWFQINVIKHQCICCYTIMIAYCLSFPSECDYLLLSERT